MTAGIVLSPRRQVVLGALVTGATQEAAAAAAGVTGRTVRRYLSEPLFQAELRRQQDEALGVITRRLQHGANLMMDVLEEVATDRRMSPAVRVRAALGWLSEAWRARELEDLAARVALLERTLQEVDDEGS